VPFIKEGLAKRERCVYVVDDLQPTEVTEALVAAGVNVNRESERGALELTNARAYFGLPPFDALRAVELMRKRVTEASAHGFAGLRIAGEMTWTLKEGIGDHALAEYESLLDKAIGPGLLTLACMYRRDRFRPAVLQQLVRSHAKVVAGDHVWLNLSALFQNLARSDLREFLQSASERRKRKGELYFRQGDQATEVFVLTHGKVKLVRTEPDGRSVILRIIAPTEPFGNRGALAGTTRLASAQASEDSRALVWNTPTILQVMMHHPAVSLNTVRLMSERIQEERGRLLDLAGSSAERRLAQLLLRLAQSMGRKTLRGVAIEVPLSGHDLAELVITTPYTVSRILAGWKRRRIVDARRGRILILDQQRIAAIAGGTPKRRTPQAG
jgi:CRP-like cAMP-binding protein